MCKCNAQKQSRKQQRDVCVSVCAVQFFLLRLICLQSIYNAVKAIMRPVFHSTNKMKLLHPQPRRVQWFKLLPCGEVYAGCWGVQFCKVMAWTCWAGLVAPQGWISTSAHPGAHTQALIRTYTLNEVRIQPQQHSSALIVSQGWEWVITSNWIIRPDYPKESSATNRQISRGKPYFPVNPGKPLQSFF